MDAGEWVAFFSLPAFGAGAWIWQRRRGEAVARRLDGLETTKRLGLTVHRPRLSGFFPTLHWPDTPASSAFVRMRSVRHGVQAELVFDHKQLRLAPRVRLEAQLSFLLPPLLGTQELGHLAHDAVPLVWRWRASDDRARAMLQSRAVRAALVELEGLSGVAGVGVSSGRRLVVAVRARIDDENWLNRMVDSLDAFCRVWLAALP